MINNAFSTPKRSDKSKKFMRKPAERSERSSSRRSMDSDIKEKYIKSPGSTDRERVEDDFFTSLASTLLNKNQPQTPQTSRIRYKNELSERKMKGEIFTDFQNFEPNNKMIETYKAELELKNHEIGVISGEVQRARALAQEEKERRVKVENERKNLSKELKQTIKMYDNAQTEIKKLLKEKEHLLKQIDFLEKINYDEKTRSLQSYREKYLEDELTKLRIELAKSREGKEQEFLSEINKLTEEKYTMESNLKAMKVANECLIRQINQIQSNFHEIVVNSEEYKKLRDKYIKFLEEYKMLRNEYWALKAELNTETESESFMLSITSDEIENDLSVLKNSLGNNTHKIMEISEIQELQLPEIKEIEGMRGVKNVRETKEFKELKISEETKEKEKKQNNFANTSINYEPTYAQNRVRRGLQL